ncbi:MAG: hypothetical protein RL662_574 [Bacteroidota bacterium]|jgi:hypothetical protein
MTKQKKARLIAFYLPQFHPIPENDEWWGKGFTEWTNVGKAKPLFKGHYQPHVPADLGYYDLRVAETRKAQADMARSYGVEGFCYWHYWFGNGKRLLERPFNEVLESKESDFPFCLAWANESWKGFEHGLTNRNVLIEQLYPGIEDYTNHFYEVLPAFRDKRYMTVDGKPIFIIYKPLANNEVKSFIETWRQLAIDNGLSGIFFVGHNNNPKYSVDEVLGGGVDVVNTVRLNDYLLTKSLIKKIRTKLNLILRDIPNFYPYNFISKYFINHEIDSREDVFPSIISGWDHTPRSGKDGLVLTNYTPSSFERHVEDVLNTVAGKKEERRIVFVKSWNEWAEGNYMEPDLKWGHSYLEALYRQIK